MLEFTRYRTLFYAISAALLLPGLISLALPGGLRPSIDFTSGTLMTVRRQAGLPPVAIGESVSIRWDKEQARLLEGRPVSALA